MLVEEYDFQIIANLLSGSGEAQEKLIELKRFLKEHNLTYRCLEITSPTPISQIPSDGRIHIKKGVICLGGDGTVSETVGYVLNHQIAKPIALIPTGTANIIANTLGLENKNGRFDFLLTEKIKTVDVGVADFERERDYFLLGLGVGFEENFLRLTKEKFKRHLGIFSYILAALSELLSLKKIPLELKIPGKTFRVEVCLLTILNLPPSILKFFPLFKFLEIDGTDKKFNLYYVEYRNFLSALWGTLIFHLLGSRNFGLVKSLSAEKITLTSPVICRTQLDGELRAALPVTISFHRQPISFFTP